MSSKKIGQSREVFLDFTMNDDNNLVEQINEIDKNFGLNIAGEGNKVTHAKVSMPKSETERSTTKNSGTASAMNELKAFSLDDLVKETEGLIETISETVQETAKISSQTSEIDWTISSSTADEETNDCRKQSIVANNDVDLQAEEAIDATEPDATNDDMPYTPHFIAEELGQESTSKASLRENDEISTGGSEVFSSAHLFDDDFEMESDVLHQTGSFLFNTKELRFNVIDEEGDIAPTDKLESPTDTSAEAEISHMNSNNSAQEHVSRLHDLQQEKQTEHEAEELNTDIDSDDLFDDITFPPLQALSRTDEMSSEKNVTELDKQDVVEPTIVAKLEDIDVLLQKLDDLSMKEMVSTLASNDQTRKDTARKRDLTLDMLLEEHTPNIAGDAQEDVADIREEAWAPLTTNSTSNDTISEENESNMEKQDQENDRFERESTTDENGQDQLNIDLFTPQMSELKMRDVRLEEAMVQTLAKAQKTTQSERAPLKTPAMAHPSLAEQTDLLTKKDDVYKTRDLIDTQPINLREIEKMNMQNNRDAELSIKDSLQAETVEGQSVSKITAQNERKTTEKTEETTQEHRSHESTEQLEHDETFTTFVAEEQILTQKTNQVASVEQATEVKSDDVKTTADDKTCLHQTQSIDISQFSHSFEHSFAKANATQKTADESFMQTDELMNLHEKMMQTDALYKTTRLKEHTPQAMRFNFADVLKEAEAMQEVNEARDVAREQLVSIDHIPALDETTEQQHQDATNELNFVEWPNEERTINEKTAGIFHELDEFEALARKTEYQSQNSSVLNDDVRQNTVGDDAEVDVEMKEQAIVDTGTTLINLSVADITKYVPNNVHQQPASGKRVSEASQLPISRSEANTQTEVAADKKTKNMLLVTVVGLSIVILALVVIIIFQLMF